MLKMLSFASYNINVKENLCYDLTDFYIQLYTISEFLIANYCAML